MVVPWESLGAACAVFDTATIWFRHAIWQPFFLLLVLPLCFASISFYFVQCLHAVDSSASLHFTSVQGASVHSVFLRFS